MLRGKTILKIHHVKMRKIYSIYSYSYAITFHPKKELGDFLISGGSEPIKDKITPRWRKMLLA